MLLWVIPQFLILYLIWYLIFLLDLEIWKSLTFCDAVITARLLAIFWCWWGYVYELKFLKLKYSTCQQLWFTLDFLPRQKRLSDQEFDRWSVKYWSRPIFATDAIAANHWAGVTKVTANIYCRKHLLPQTSFAANSSARVTKILPQNLLQQTIQLKC